MSLSAFSSRLFPTMRSQAMARFAAPSSTFARFYATKLYSEDHEWVKVDGDVATIGITEHAQAALGEIVFVQLPEIQNISKTDPIGSVESVKAASDIYAPVSGEVVAVNATLQDDLDPLNESPETDGWLCKIKLSDKDEIKELLSEEKYKEFCESA